jgi:tetratricopeptide (TPR) repeat protein/TolB-like protein
MQDVLELLREGLAPRYSVERQIGAGGMARVYLATEQHPRRPVAIKVLEPDVSTRLLYDRFIREVELSSRLSHPHIVPIFAAGEVGGLLYYVMPYIEGESLRQRLLKGGALPLEDALHMALDIADALAYAHAQGIVHRDIKPENILLSGGHPVIADFGVARAISAAGGQSLTQTGHAVGSPGYMSPEQAMGSEVDARSDIYSLGCVLFELLTGEAPVRVGLERRIGNWQALDTGKALRGTGTGGSRAVKHAVSKALAPSPEDRFANVTEFADALGGSAHRPSLPRRGRFARRRSWRAAVLGVGLIVLAGVIAVAFARRVPALTSGRVVVTVIENRTGDSTLANLGHMAADWVTQGLAQTGLVEVVPSVDVMGHGAGHLDIAGIRALGRETRARTVVSGAYYKQGDSVRFQIEITDARDGKVLRALDPIVGPVTNPLAPVEAVRQRVMIALATLFNPKLMNWAGAASQPPDFEAYQEFVEGLDRFARFDWRSASEHLERAAAGDSTFTVALIWSATAHLNLGESAIADSIARRIERSNRRLAPVDRSYLSWVEAKVRGDLPGALEAARELARVAPGSDALFLVGEGATALNRPREAAAAFTEIGPDRGLFRGSSLYWWDLTAALHMLGDHRRELKEANEGRRRLPGQQLWMLACEARALAALGRLDDVRQRLDESLDLSPQPGWTPASVALLAAQELRAHGFGDAAREAASRAIAWHERRPSAEQESAELTFGLGASYYEAGRLEDARKQFDRLVALQPAHAALGHVQSESEHLSADIAQLGYIGAIAARQGDRLEALRIDRVLAQTKRRYLLGGHTSWRARIHTLLGDRDRSIELLRAAFGEGYPYSPSLHTDLAFEALRDYPPFQGLMKPKG